jgi:exopolyphosphatase/guanosine-5'-triphosphate,3'-diphosphate pyrophosphatase
MSLILPWSRTKAPAPPDSDLSGIIDIGSNSVRLVVYQGRSRTPAVIFNEKVMAGLGRGIASDGRLSDGSMRLAVTALARFAHLANDMGVTDLRTVATAAVREARNAQRFIDIIADRCGLTIEVISGEAEARGAALGVIAGIPHADGIVGDLGGGSLELIRVEGGEAHDRISLPIGALRLDAVRKRGSRALRPFIAAALDRVDWAAKGVGKPFYMVGGSWRALVQLHIYLHDYPLPVIHQYAMDPGAPDRLVRSLARIDPKTLKDVTAISTSRLPSLPGAALLLGAVVKRLGSSAIVASAYGLREGLLYERMSPALQAEDPLIAAARDEGARQGRFPEHGDMLMAWMDGLFAGPEAGGSAAGEAPDMRRLRLATCLLSDVAWRAHPDFRPERGLDVALHGNWVAIDARERALLAAALVACFGGTPTGAAAVLLDRLADAPSLATARRWGLALRLGQRLTGGTAVALQASRLTAADSVLTLTLAARDAPLYGEAVARRLKLLAASLGCEAANRFT